MNDKLRVLALKPIVLIVLVVILVTLAIIIKRTETKPTEQSKEAMLDTINLPRRESSPATTQQENKIINLMTPSGKTGDSDQSIKSSGKKEKEDIFKAMSL
ncbi:hypothetical protein HY948_02295 [Candidatus Gottesmanbacteria bacterium]|nr:hypothetical protein [Candidatus Gottesmanbacteria bacterium]